MTMTLKQGSLKVTGIDTNRSDAYDFLLTMDLSCTVSEINGDFSRKSQIFPARVLCAAAEGVPFGIGYQKTRMTGYNAEQKV